MQNGADATQASLTTAPRPCGGKNREGPRRTRRSERHAHDEHRAADAEAAVQRDDALPRGDARRLIDAVGRRPEGQAKTVRLVEVRGGVKPVPERAQHLAGQLLCFKRHLLTEGITPSQQEGAGGYIKVVSHTTLLPNFLSNRVK